VIGAGVWGLATARAALARGLSVIVIEARTVGAGASGGIVGALSPHVPERWNAKKAFQFRALCMARDYWPEVQADSGLPTGYAPSGRLMPLADERARQMAADRADAARQHWGDAASWRVVGPDAAPGWLAASAAPCGAVHETLSARLYPRAACAALAEAVRRAGGIVQEGEAALSLAPGQVRTAENTYPAEQLVVAAGTAGFDLLGIPGHRGVKGQAALLRARVSDHAPLLFADGVYAVPQPGGLVAVGSTSENQWDDAAPDQRLDPVIAAARTLSRALAAPRGHARGAGSRPRARRPEPMLGPVPGMPGVLAALGGFKIGFGLAPLVAETLADMIEGARPDLPPGFAAAEQMGRDGPRP